VSSLGYEPRLNYLSVVAHKMLLDASLVCNLSLPSVAFAKRARRA